LGGRKCKCEYEISILFTEDITQEVALFNLNHCDRNLMQILKDSIKINEKIIDLTLGGMRIRIIRVWIVGLGCVYLFGYFTESLFFQIFSYFVAFVLSSVVFYSDSVRKSAEFFLNSKQK
jgi:hypothetical protein